MITYDCKPTLNDTQVVEFCKKGFLMLEGVVPDEVNRRTLEYLEANPSMQPSQILLEDWFDRNVMKNPESAGVVRSLLGRDFALPNLVSNHRVECPLPAQEWHFDGGSKYGPELNYLQVFYYPQDCPVELGPTELLPGSHFLFAVRKNISHLGGIRGSYRAAAPAGSIFLTAYHVWHRRGPSTAAALRNMLKYFYWRTTPPQRDWIVEEDFDFAAASYGSPIASIVEQFRADIKVAELFLWLCGQRDSFQNLGGQSWPLPAHRRDTPYGFPAALAHSQ